ncbi:MAG: ROK family transcriptional regulator [Firmicutes bacterium]|nr:ROK family transcriptional regulator [Bacillota bacterium]
MLAFVRRHGSLSRAELARRTRLSLPTVAAIVRDLERDGLVRVLAGEARAGAVGRPSPQVELNPGGAYVLALDIGATVTRMALVDLLGTPVREESVPTPRGGAKASVRALRALVEGLAAHVDRGRLRGAAIGVPGYVTADRRTVAYASNLPGWRDLALADALEETLGVPCVLDNDVNMAAIGEGQFGVARSVADYVYLDLGTGIGAGVVVNGRLHRGAHGLGGELSLAAVPGRARRRHRSIECDSAGWALRRHARRLGYDDVPALFAAAAAGDARAARVLGRATDTLALAIANMCSVLDPALVVLGGGLARQDAWLDATRRLLAERLPYPPRVERTLLAGRAAVLGAAAVALDLFSQAPMTAFGGGEG